MNTPTYKAIALSILPLALYACSMQLYASDVIVPKDWQAHPPYRIKPNTNSLVPSGFSPAQVLKAYNYPANLQGSGQIVAIVDAMDNPNVEADLATYSNTFGLPACTTANGCFTKIYSGGSQPAGDSHWGLEIALDVEWVHAIAPLAKIILIEAPDAGIGLYNAITTAIQHHATVISCSWGGAEFSSESSLDSIFQNSPVPIVVASGDSGAGVNYPAASPYVLSVGGTNITLNSDGSYANETAWSGSSGGLSAYETVPTYQSNFPIPQNPHNKRGVPDVSYIADPNTGFSVYDSYGQAGWLVVGGTSAGAPQWAALIAIANSAAGTNKTTVNSTIYSNALAAYSTLFHDITTGSNGSCGYYCQAGVGYDYVTGLGSPKATTLISSLVSGAQIIQISNSLFNSEARTPGVTQSAAIFKFYTGSAQLCDTRTVNYSNSLTLEPGVSGAGTGHTTCTVNEKITSITATPIIANATIGAVYGSTPASYTVTNASGITQVTLQQKPADSSDYSPVFNTSNGTVATAGTPDLA